MAPAILTALVALSLVGFPTLFDGSFLQSDSAQYLSIAKNLRAGHGAATSLVWTEEHHLLGGIPVAQTNMPPGYPMLIALVSELGVTPLRAALLVCIAGFAAIPLLVYCLLRSAGRDRRLALVLSSLWFFLPIVWVNVLACLSEMSYALLSLACLACIVQADRRPVHATPWLLLAGAAAGLAFAVRYVGLVLILTLGLLFLARLIARRDAASLRALLLVSAPAAAFGLTLLVRNYRLTGTLVGGLRRDDSNSLAAVLRTVYWSLSELTGFSKAGLLRGDVAEWLLVIFALAALGWLVSGVRATLDRGALRRALTRSDGAFSLVYVIGSLVFLIAAAKTHASGAVAARYLVPLIPFALLLLPYAAELLRLEPRGRRQRLAAAALGAGALLVFLAGQVDVAGDHWSARRQSRYLEIHRVMQQPFGTGTLGDFLSQHVTSRSPLLANEAQLIGVVLDRPVVGLPGASYSTRVWTADETRRVLARYGVAYVVLFPGLLDPCEADLANQPFFADLERGRVPAWLEPAFSASGVRLYHVTSAGA